MSHHTSSNVDTEPTKIIILGGSYTALTVAHHLLKYTLPVCSKLSITSVAPSTHLYWNTASPRFILPSGHHNLSQENVFQEITQGFTHYPEGSFTFVPGRATFVDVVDKHVVVQRTDDAKTTKVEYDHLVICTGSSTIDGMPWKSDATFEETLKSIQDIRDQIEKARRIVVGGGGATGIEVAAEIACAYKQKGKEIVLVNRNSTLLHPAPAKAGAKIQKELEKLYVMVINDAHVDTVKPENGRYEIFLSNGDTITADLYLPTTGLRSNTSFLPKDMLNARCDVVVDECLRVAGQQEVWAAGDVTHIQAKKVKEGEDQALHLAKNIHATLLGQKSTLYKEDNPDMFAVVLGRDRGVGMVLGWMLPSLVVWYVKGRTYFTENIVGLVYGRRLYVAKTI